jgi:hypothetical protein
LALLNAGRWPSAAHRTGARAGSPAVARHAVTSAFALVLHCWCVIAADRPTQVDLVADGETVT